MNESSFRVRLFCCFLAVVVVTLVLPGLYVRHAIKEEGIAETVRSAEREAGLAVLLLGEAAGPEELPRVLDAIKKKLSLRVTFIDQAGKVLAESDRRHVDPADMDNHADRVEIINAAQNGVGISIRHSNTLDTDLVYVAVPFPSVRNMPSGFIRVAAPLDRVEARIAASERQWLGIIGLALLLALGISYALSSRLERSLREMIRVVEGIATDPDGRIRGRRRLHVLPGREFRRLARAVNDMADRTEDHLRTIAEHKAQLKTILDSMDEGVLVVGAQGRIRLVNPALTRLFPLTAQAEGKLPVEVVPVAEIQQALDTLLASPREDKTKLIALEVEPRPETVLSVHLIRPREAAHDVMAVAVFHDISEMARLMRVRKEFVANVSHELRTPLTAIIGYAETLKDTPPDDAAASGRFAEIILRNARHMATMVEDLLRLSRIESGAVPMDPVPLKAETILADVATACGPLAATREQSLLSQVEAGLTIKADAHFIAQVFRNLIENACRYAPEGTAIVIAGEARKDGMAVFTVHDEGPGIPAPELTRVFERFYRVEKHRSSPASTGLGLAICKHIVERHGGVIWAEEGPGGLFRFTVPLAQEA